jgi:DNA-binding response OmpR family regulator
VRALIVDDDEPIRVMLSTIIKQQGFSVDTASDGGEAIEKLKNGSYHVVLLDLMMPKVNGYDVLRHLRQTNPELLRRTIVATAVPERELHVKLTDPVYKVHSKPFELPQLLADIRQCAAS